MSSENVHKMDKQLFSAKILHEQEIYKTRYNVELEQFLTAGDRALSRLFNSLSEEDIVQHYYTQQPCRKNITRIYPMHENSQAPWVNSETACDELELHSKALSAFREALNTANMDLELEIIEKQAKRTDAQKQYYFSVKFTDYNAHSL